MIKFAAVAIGTTVIVEECLKLHHNASEQVKSALELAWPFQRVQNSVSVKG